MTRWAPSAWIVMTLCATVERILFTNTVFTPCLWGELHMPSKVALSKAPEMSFSKYLRGFFLSDGITYSSKDIFWANSNTFFCLAGILKQRRWKWARNSNSLSRHFGMKDIMLIVRPEFILTLGIKATLACLHNCGVYANTNDVLNNFVQGRQEDAIWIGRFESDEIDFVAFLFATVIETPFVTRTKVFTFSPSLVYGRENFKFTAPCLRKRNSLVVCFLRSFNGLGIELKL